MLLQTVDRAAEQFIDLFGGILFLEMEPGLQSGPGTVADNLRERFRQPGRDRIGASGEFPNIAFPPDQPESEMVAESRPDSLQQIAGESAASVPGFVQETAMGIQ